MLFGEPHQGRRRKRDRAKSKRTRA